MLVGEGSGKCIYGNKDILMRKTVNSDEEIPEGGKKGEFPSVSLLREVSRKVQK